MLFELQKVTKVNKFRYDKEGNLTDKKVIYYQLVNEGIEAPIIIGAFSYQQKVQLDLFAKKVIDNTEYDQPKHIDIKKGDIEEDTSLDKYSNNEEKVNANETPKK